MIANDGIVEPHPKSFTCIFNSIVAVGDWVGNEAGDLIQRNIVGPKAPDEIFYVLDVFLMGLGGKDGLKQPLAIMDLENLSHLLEGSDTLHHDWYFLLAVANLLNSNGGSSSSVENTLMVLDGDKSTMLIKHTPEFLDRGCETCALLRLQVRQVKFLGKALTMVGLGIHKVESWIVLVKGRGIKLLLPENNAAIDIMN